MGFHSRYEYAFPLLYSPRSHWTTEGNCGQITSSSIFFFSPAPFLSYFPHILSGRVLGAKSSRPVPAKSNVSEQLAQWTAQGELWPIFRSIYDIAAGYYTANRETIQAAWDKANSLQYSCCLPEKGMLSPSFTFYARNICSPLPQASLTSSLYAPILNRH